MTSTLMIIQIVLAIIITIAILLQKSSSIGLGAYSGSNESLFGAKGPMGFLAKFTFAVAILFIINTLVLGYYYSKANTSSVTDGSKTKTTIPVSSKEKTPVSPVEIKPTKTKQAPSTPKAPMAPAIPKAQSNNTK